MRALVNWVAYDDGVPTMAHATGMLSIVIIFWPEVQALSWSDRVMLACVLFSAGGIAGVVWEYGIAGCATRSQYL